MTERDARGHAWPLQHEHFLVWLLAATAACIMTWPLVLEVGRVGRVDVADGEFSLWNVAWVAHALVTDPKHLFDANIFYPHRGTLAYSEPNIAAGILAVPAYWATQNPYLAHNLVVLFAFTLSGVAMYWLVRHLTGHSGAAAVAAVAFAYCPYVMAHTASIQLLLIAGLPLSLLAFHRLVENPTSGRAMMLGLALAGQALACGYYGVFIALTVAFGVVFMAVSGARGWSARYWATVGVAALIAMLLVLPFFLPYVQLQRTTGFARPLDDARMYSADWRAYLASPAHAHAWLLALLSHWNEVLFPGILMTVFAARTLRRLPQRGACAFAGGTREMAVFYALLALLAGWASFGPDAGFYTVLYRVVPVFSLLWAPARFGVLVTLACTVLASMAIAQGLRSARHPGLSAGALTLLVAAELTVVPLQFPAARSPAEAYRLLAALPPYPVVELPFFSRRFEFYRHARYMLNSTVHWHPLVNGYSDVIPQDFRDLAPVLAPFPTCDSLAALRTRGVRYAVFTLSAYSPDDRAALRARLSTFREYFRLINSDDDVRLYELLWPPLDGRFTRPMC